VAALIAMLVARLRGESRSKARFPEPASGAAIAAAEEEQGWAFPPSYRAFLRIHDGLRLCDCGPHDFSGFTGVASPLSTTYRRRLAYVLQIQRLRWLIDHGPRELRARLDPFPNVPTALKLAGDLPTPEMIEAYESQRAARNPKTPHAARLYVPGQYHFGMVLGQMLYFFIPRTRRRSGEMAVGLRSTYRDRERLLLFDDFAAVLRHEAS
jgi:hypothetical protein